MTTPTPPAARISTCKSCHQPIQWARTARTDHPIVPTFHK